MKNATTDCLTIVMVTNNYFPYQAGVAQSVHASVQALQERGHTVYVVTLALDGVPHDPPHVMRVPSVFRTRYKANHLALPWRPFAYIHTLLARIRPDIVHTHHPWLLGAAGRAAARSLGCPAVFTYHTLYHEYAHYIPVPSAVTRYCITRTVQAHCQQVNHLIVPTSPVQEVVRTQGVTTPSTIVPSAIRDCFFTTHHKQKRTQGTPLKLVYVGRLVREKNVIALFDCLSLLPPELYEFDCVGYGAQWDALQQYAYTVCNLDPQRVRFHHKPHEAALVTFYTQADLFLFPSTTDTQGLVLAEAMARGTPVLALDGPGQRAIIRDGYNGYLVATAQAMAACIVQLAHNIQLLERLRLGAYATAQHYTREQHVVQLERVYTKIL